ncbi:hypothetical protein DIS24_g5642 [Lasiodiplodia hormozganensis]|uniref:Heme haloperoxidase family profile domain-containing protein n=1 Tax=Lasiodiplodia hormozganensis TaxID=869390 RepID=A0AA40CYI5_9PEZI|nr:hypothetical protein DIS24_g5642 [Lasiodiplodia hormozganensis]
MPSSWLALGAAALAGQAAAFPALADQYAAQSSQKEKRVNGISPGFDAEAQRIDVSGLNALANHGNNFAVVRSQWDALFAKQSGVPDAQSNYGLGLLTDFRVERFQQSISSNPYFFNAPFSGVVVQPAAYTFIYRFMANKSAENPEGVLTKEVLKSFFGFTGPDDDMVHNPGWERIPENWYKRALGDEYTIPFYALDLNAAALQHPQFLDIGGNTGTTNSFTPIDLQNLTGGLYNAQTLLDGNNLACFGFQAAVQFAPDLLKGLVKDLAGALGQLGDALTSALNGLGCPQLGGEAWDEGSLDQFPGWTKLKDDGTYP